jgi:hypothetical protein
MLRNVEAAKGSLPTDPIYFTNLASQHTPEICSVKEASEEGGGGGRDKVEWIHEGITEETKLTTSRHLSFQHDLTVR